MKNFKTFLRNNKTEVVVILIDMQKRFVRNLKKGEIKRIVPKQKIILETCNSLDIPVVVLEYLEGFWSSSFGETIPILMKLAQKNSAFKLIKKNQDDGFYGTGLDSHLKSLGAKILFIMGINADYCVKETAESAIRFGYKIVTSEEIIAGQSCHSRDNSIPWFETNGELIKI